MANLFNKIFYNKELNKKGWKIKGVQTDPTQNNNDDNIDIEDVDLKLILTKEKDTKEIVTTIQVKGQEYSFIMYDEIIEYINKLKKEEAKIWQGQYL